MIVKALGMILFTAGFGLVIASPLGGMSFSMLASFIIDANPLPMILFTTGAVIVAFS